MARRNIVAGCLLLVISLTYGFLTAGLPERGLPNTPGPAFFPWGITAALTLLSLALLIRGLRGAGDSQAPPVIGARGWLALGAFLGYAVLLPVLGFLAASIPFFAALMLLYGERRRVLVALTAIVVPTLIAWVFRYGFQILLPRSAWW